MLHGMLVGHVAIGAKIKIDTSRAHPSYSSNVFLVAFITANVLMLYSFEQIERKLHKLAIVFRKYIYLTDMTLFAPW